MINFSSHNIQKINRSGYIQTNANSNRGASETNSQSPIETAEKIYNYTKTITSPTLKYFVSNIAYNSQFEEESNITNPIQPDGTTRLKVGYANDIHGQYLKLEKMGSALRDCDLRFSGGDNMLGDDRNEKINK